MADTPFRANSGGGPFFRPVSNRLYHRAYNFTILYLYPIRPEYSVCTFRWMCHRTNFWYDHMHFFYLPRFLVSFSLARLGKSMYLLFCPNDNGQFFNFLNGNLHIHILFDRSDRNQMKSNNAAVLIFIIIITSPLY